jgi:dUTP pyrophosphatase
MKHLRICKLHPKASLPQYASEGAACFDLHAATVDGKAHVGATVTHGHPIVCGTGLAFEVPEGWVLEIHSRSGQGFHHDVRLANCTGIIDSDYRGEIMVKLSADLNAYTASEYYVHPGDRIAQARLVPAPRCSFEVVEQLTLTERGSNGFGSTGQEGLLP